MPYTMEDFRRDYAKEHLKDLTLDERLEGLSAKELLQRFSLEERLEGLSPEQIENYFQHRKLPPTSPSKRKKKN